MISIKEYTYFTLKYLQKNWLKLGSTMCFKEIIYKSLGQHKTLNSKQNFLLIILLYIKPIIIFYIVNY